MDVNLIRSLKTRYASTQSPLVYGQIENLRIRLVLIRNMQAFAYPCPGQPQTVTVIQKSSAVRSRTWAF